MDNDAFGFIGFGLIGGSIAAAIHQNDPNACIIAYDHHTTTTNQNLTHAKEDGVITTITHSLSELRTCKTIFLCAPVDQNIRYLTLLKPYLMKDTILTDVGSVKGEIHSAVNELHMNENFIGGHPMAGSEKTGYDHSSPQLLENAYYILTPTNEVAPEKVTYLYQLVQRISAIPILLDANEHDDITAAISHVPHLVAASLVNLLRDNDDEGENMKMLAAGGFKDITRIASSSPSLWESICISNKESIQKFLRKYIQSLETLYTSLKEGRGDVIYDAFDTANQYRSSIPNHHGLMPAVYDIYLDIKDETGAIATIAVLLASHNISIKNIGIIHNREFQQGVLRIETYKEEDRSNALALLNTNNYTVYER